jgi:hypothetical protein
MEKDLAMKDLGDLNEPFLASCCACTLSLDGGNEGPPLLKKSTAETRKIKNTQQNPRLALHNGTAKINKKSDLPSTQHKPRRSS